MTLAQYITLVSVGAGFIGFHLIEFPVKQCFNVRV